MFDDDFDDSDELEGGADAQSEEPSLIAPEPTGHAEVDDVASAVAALTGRPLDEHVAVFDDAHTRLRRALDDRP